jgi:hypothetical protein
VKRGNKRVVTTCPGTTSTKPYWNESDFGLGAVRAPTAADTIKTKMPGTPSRSLSKKKKAELAAVALAAKTRKSQLSHDDDDDDDDDR